MSDTTSPASPPSDTRPRLVRRNYGRGHGYRLDGRKIPGVTTVLGLLDKPALREWYAKEAAKRVIDYWDEIVAMPPSARMDFVQRGPRERNKAAALRGTEIHALGAQLAAGEEVEVPPEHRGPVEAYARWMDEWDVVPIAAEVPVAYTVPGSEYGGTADLWCDLGARDSATALVDIKTGSGIFHETPVQLAAYGHADLSTWDGKDWPIEPPDLFYVAHVLPDAVRMVPIYCDASTHRTFLYLLQVYKAVEEWKEAPLIGEAERP